jgi:small subunit ribosomal protein S16
VLSRTQSRIFREFKIMVKIRLARAGAKKRPFYHVVATESRSSRDGKFIERLGFYNPNAKGGEQRLVVDQTRVDYWKSQGAQISERVAFLVKGVAVAAAPVAEPAA